MGVVEKIEKGQQVGLRRVTEKDGETVYYSLAVQKWENKYIIYTMEIEESKLGAFEDYEEDAEHLIERDTLGAVIEYLADELNTDINDLHPLRGQKIFHPN